MQVLFDKMEIAFELSDANKVAQQHYQTLFHLHSELVERVTKLRTITAESISGKTEEEVINTITQLEKKIDVIGNKLHALKKSIGGGY